MKINSPVLIEYLGAEDTKDMPFGGLHMVITTEILDDPEALEEYSMIIESFPNIDTIFLKMTKNDPHLIEKLTKVFPNGAKSIIVFGEFLGQNFDFTSSAFDSLEEFMVIKDNLTGKPDEDIICAVGDIKLPKSIKRVLLNHLDGLGTIEVPPEAQESLAFAPASETTEIEGLCIPGIKRIETTLIKAGELKKIREMFPDVTAIRQGSRATAIDISIDKAEELIAKMQMIIDTGSYKGTRDEIKELIIFANGNADFSYRMRNFIIRDDSIVDTEHFPCVPISEFDFDSLGDSKHAKIILKDATELSSEEAKRLLEEASKRGVKLAIQFNEEDASRSAKVPMTLETYLECSKVMDEIIDEALTGLPENASETEKYSRIYRILSERYHYDHNALEEVNPIEALLRNDSSRNITSLLTGECVCAGYAEIMKHLARRIGLECVYDHGDVISFENNPLPTDNVIGALPDGRKVVSGGHAWVRVKLDGEWKMSDPTWDHNRFVSGKDPIYIAFSEEQGRKAGRKSSLSNMPECTTSLSREEIAALYPDLSPHDLYTMSDAELYGMSRDFKQYTDSEPTMEDRRRPDSQAAKKYIASLPKEPRLQKIIKSLGKAFTTVGSAIKGAYEKIVEAMKRTKERLINGKEETPLLEPPQEDKKIEDKLSKYKVDPTIIIENVETRVGVSQNGQTLSSDDRDYK